MKLKPVRDPRQAEKRTMPKVEVVVNVFRRSLFVDLF